MEREEYAQTRRPKVFSSERGAVRRTYALLRSALAANHVGQEDQLVEDLLSSTLSTSRNAVRQALQMLVDDGIVRRQPHSGTRIVHGMIRATVDGYLFFGMEPEEARRRVEIVEIENRVVPAPPLVSRILDLPDDQMLLVEHLVKLDGVPICIDAGFHAAHIPPERFAVGHDQNTVFEQYYGSRVGGSERSFQALSADAATAKVLDVPIGSPLLLQDLVLRDAHGVPRELRYTHYRGDRVTLVTRRDDSDVPVEAVISGLPIPLQ